MTKISGWNWHRFFKLTGLNLRVDKTYIGIRAFVLCALTFVVLTLLAPGSSEDNGIAALKMTGFLFVVGFADLLAICLGVMYAARAFQAFKQRETGWLAVLLPASKAEKYFSALLLHAIVVPTLYLLVFAIPALGVIMMNDHISFDVFNDLMTMIPEDISVALREARLYGLYGAGIVLSWYSSYILFFLGSILNPKHPLLLGVVISIVLRILSNGIMKYQMADVDLSQVTDIQEVIGPLKLMGAVGIGYEIVCILIMLAVGWWFYNRRTVI